MKLKSLSKLVSSLTFSTAILCGVVSGATDAPTVSTGTVTANGWGPITNISCRGYVKGGEVTSVIGFVISEAKRNVYIRAVGPSLAKFGVKGFLPNPTMSIYDRNGALVLPHGDAVGLISRTAMESLFLGLGAFPLDVGSQEPIQSYYLDPGSYTVVIRGGTDESGIVLGEVYIETPKVQEE